VVDSTIAEDCRVHRKDLSVAWIDYKEAYDCVPHAWILQVLNSFNALLQLRLCVSNLLVSVRGKGATITRNCISATGDSHDNSK
jgi:hypothetical protein